MKLRAPSRASRPTTRAFSLIEIMVSVSLLAVIMVGLLAMFYQVQRAFRIGTAQADILEGGRAAMNLIVRDLQEMSAAQSADLPNCTIDRSYNPTPAPVVPGQQNLLNSTRDNYLADISFLSRKNDEWIGTAYRVSWATNGVGALYRLVINQFTDTLPQATRSNIIKLTGNLLLSSPYVGDPHDTNYALVADGIVSFNIIPYDTNGLRYVKNDPSLYPASTFDDGRGYFGTNLNSTIDPVVGLYHFRSNDLPAYVDIELAVLEPSALAKFRVREETPDNGVRAREFLRNQIGKTHVFRQRVPIRSAATDIGVRY